MGLIDLWKKQHGKMDCREASARIQEYIDDTMTDRDLERFLEHIDNCVKCYDELETFFMIDRTVHYLDTDTDASYNLKPLLKQDLLLRRKKLNNARRLRRICLIILTIGIVLMAFIILDSTGILRTLGISL